MTKIEQINIINAMNEYLGTNYDIQRVQGSSTQYIVYLGTKTFNKRLQFLESIGFVINSDFYANYIIYI